MSRPVRAPELSELETLVVCAAEGSLAAAAEQLGISRPAVAKRIGALEAIAGTALLQRDTRGVRLTEDGAGVVSQARRLLAERDALMEAILRLRQDGGDSRTSGVRALLGRPAHALRAAQRPEALLAERERLVEVLLHATATPVVITDPDTGVVDEANDAFCRFVGRERSGVLGRRVRGTGLWDARRNERERLLAELRRQDAVRDLDVRVRHPDGTLRTGRASARLVQIGGQPRVLITISAADGAG
jgi:PAS domain S-box-containing protein